MVVMYIFKYTYQLFTHCLTNHNLIIILGFKYLQPPPLPSSHVYREILLDEIATKLLQATIDPNKYETTLTITGAWWIW